MSTQCHAREELAIIVHRMVITREERVECSKDMQVCRLEPMHP